jgi:hypothetical protein
MEKMKDKDPGGTFARKIEDVLRPLTKNIEAKEGLLYSLKDHEYYAELPPLIKSYSLPEYLEEEFTIQSDRYRLDIIQGVQETYQDKMIGFVAVSQNILGWELVNIFDEKKKKEDRPKWAKDMPFDHVDGYEYWDYPWCHVRFYFVALAEYLDKPFKNMESYLRRKKTTLSVIETLHKNFGFKIRYSESGDIPKEIPDDWLCPELVEDYQSYLAAVNVGLAKDEFDPVLWFEKAGLLLSRDRSEDALVCLYEALSMEYESPEIWYLLADTFTKLYRDKDARIADSRARAIQKKQGSPPSKADVYNILKVFHLPREYKEIKPKYPEIERMECSSCDYDFPYIREGIWSICNNCGHGEPVEDTILRVDLSPVWFDIKKRNDPIGLNAIFINKTKYDITFSNSDLEVLIGLLDSEHIQKDSGEEDVFGNLKEPEKSHKIKPQGEIEIQFDLQEIEWSIDGFDSLTKRGRFIIELFVLANVNCDWEEIVTNCYSNPIFIERYK